MMPWFIWKGKNSLRDFGLWIGKLPPIIRAPERVEEITIPGRAGSLTLTEGDDIYDGYVKKCTVIIPNNRPIQPVIEWLKGTGDLVFSNEAGFAYEARITSQVSFERIGNNLMEADIQFAVKPFKKQVIEESITATESVLVYNPGDIWSKPYITVTAIAGTNMTIAMADRVMTFSDIPQILNIDCEAEIVTYYPQYPGDPAIWTGSYTGEFLHIPPGSYAFVITSSQTPFSLDIKPRWRWV